MPTFSTLKPELKKEIEDIINLAKQENINNEELTIKCKSFFESVFSDNNKSCIDECYQILFNCVRQNFKESISIPDPITILTVQLSCLYDPSSLPLGVTNLDNNED
ncbi:MAG: hypothetical protein LN567_03635 [Rickettsia endosymbiont of Graphium doson]|nr:hypothetical protein [Rickettsia endosymbiont of Graphium doson]HJD67020.1 hypothetical protein [Rickettsia endosymbiont of Bembidion lapponicum]